MSSKHRLTRSFRTISALLYVLNLIVAINFTLRRTYLEILIGVITSILCLVMLVVAIEAPKFLVEKLERNKLTENLFSFRGRYIVDVFIALFLFAMPPWGIVLGVVTLLLIFGIRFLGVKQPDAFNEIFRQSDIESQADSYTLESEYEERR